MFDQISFPQQIGLSMLAAAGVVWTVGLVRLLRRDRSEVTVRCGEQSPYAIPRQRSHSGETVRLSAAERDAFTGLVRQLTDGRP